MTLVGSQHLLVGVSISYTMTHSGCSSRKDFDAKQAEYCVVKKHHSHYRVRAGIVMAMAIPNNPGSE